MALVRGGQGGRAAMCDHQPGNQSMPLRHRTTKASLTRCLTLAAALLVVACTTSTRGLPAAGAIGPDAGYRAEHLGRDPGREPALPGRYVILAFSGGGTRATAL